MEVIKWLSAFLISIILYALCPLALAQSNSKTLEIDYRASYQLENSFSILYDNKSEGAKINTFQVTFYNPENIILAETKAETYPLTATAETYMLDRPVIGFSRIELTVLSLHDGKLEDLPTDIRTILALSKLTKITTSPPSEIGNSINENLSEKSNPAITELERKRFFETLNAIESLIDISDNNIIAINNFNKSQIENKNKLNELLNQNRDTSERTPEAHSDIKEEIDLLGKEIHSELNKSEFAVSPLELENIKSELLELKSEINLTLASHEPSLETALTSLTNKELRLDEIDRDLAQFTLPSLTPPHQIEAWAAEQNFHFAQINKLNKNNSGTIKFFAAVIFCLIVAGVLGKFLLKAKPKSRPAKASVLTETLPAGVIFPTSPMVAGNVAAPLAPIGKITASQLQMLTGPYAILKDAYLATGRIGYAQLGKPTAEDYAFGTGFLISDRHVMTNRHVHGLYGHYLLDKSDPGGIEFIAEKDKDNSDFVAFNGDPPLLLSNLDIAIYTLSRPVRNRRPIIINESNTDALVNKDIVVIGYPDTSTPDKPEIKAVVEDNPIFAVKRISQGKVFKHSTEMAEAIGVKTTVSVSDSSDFKMPAVCHNASTMTGNSGSPLLDIKTGHLVGVHFAGFKVFNKAEAANLAMTVKQLIENSDAINLSCVISVTDGVIEIT